MLVDRRWLYLSAAYSTLPGSPTSSYLVLANHFQFGVFGSLARTEN